MLVRSRSVSAAIAWSNGTVRAIGTRQDILGELHGRGDGVEQSIQGGWDGVELDDRVDAEMSRIRDGIRTTARFIVVTYCALGSAIEKSHVPSAMSASRCR
jgi:hypothetical protein